MTAGATPPGGFAEHPRLPELRTVALEAMRRAYAPYSRFRVGAALLTRDGVVVPGCNVENAAYPASICAERGAVLGAVAQGHREFVGIVIATEADEPTPPCGQCRQVLVEFDPALPIVSVARGGRERAWSLADLLPSPFTPSSLGGTP
jgi:cytidine deaminase